MAGELSPADWMIPLGAEDAAEIAAALAAIAAAAPEPPMPRCAALFATLRARLLEGRGFALLRGLSADGTPGGAGALFGLLSRHLGGGAEPAPAQPLSAEAAPGFESGAGLRALLAMEGAGGVTLVSAGALHNAMLLADRALLGELYDPLPHAGPDGLTAVPVFGVSEAGFASRFAPDRIEAAVAKPHNAPIARRQRAAVAMLAGLAEDPVHALKLEMRPGDLLCLDAGRVWLRRLAPAGDVAPAFLLDPL